MVVRVTQKQIAASLGLHPTSVSLALSGDRRIPPETRQRIRQEASRLGYERDPMLGALSAYRRSQRVSNFHGLLAWLVNTGPGELWTNIRDYRDYHRGAQDRAHDRGYKIDTIDIHEFRENPRRLTKILRARNVRGVFFCPQPKPHMSLDVDVAEVAAVTFGYTLKSPVVHAVTSHHHRSMVTAFRQLHIKGYRRIGYVFPRLIDDRLEDHLISGFLAEQRKLPAAEQAPPFAGSSVEEFNAWLAAEKPDAVITARYHSMPIFPIPAGIGVALIGRNDEVCQYSGIDECSLVIGHVAADFLIGMVERGETGVPEHPQRLMVESRWCEAAPLSPPAANLAPVAIPA